MADTTTLVQGSVTLDLNDTTNYEHKSIHLFTPPDRNLWFSPDHGESKLIRSEAAERNCRVKLRVKGAAAGNFTAEDVLQNNINALRRYMDEAQRHSKDGDTDAVYLTLQKNNATNTTRHKILSGAVDDSASHYRAERRNVTQALDVVLLLVLAPYGEWDSSITLQNDMLSSPHFVEDSNADGLADGWGQFNTPTSTSIDTTNWLVGGQSQETVTDATNNEGIICDAVTAAQSSNLVAYAWVFPSAGDTVRISLVDGSLNSIQSKSLQLADAGSVSDKSTVDSAGNSWYRVVVSGSNTAAADARLIIHRHNADASANSTFYVDACYLEVGTTTAPDAWASSKNIDNRNDIQSTSQATENYLNYVDVWGIPGDAPALCRVQAAVTDNAGSPHNGPIILASWSDGKTPAAKQPHWLEADHANITETASNASWGDTPAAGSRSNGNARRLTDGGAGSGTGLTQYIATGTDAEDLARNDKHVYLIGRSSATNSTVQGTGYRTVGGLNPTDQPVLSFAVADTWEVLDLGIAPVGGEILDSRPDSANSELLIGALITTPTASATVDIDAIIALPIEQNLVIYKNSLTTGNEIWFDGIQGGAILTEDNKGRPEAPAVGSWSTLEPQKANRIVWVQYVTDMDFADEAVITVVVTPRTRHLLGTA